MSLAHRIQGQQANERQNWSANLKDKNDRDQPDKYAELKMNVHREVIDSIEQDNKLELQGEDLTDFAREKIGGLLERDAIFLPFSERQVIAREIMDEVLGLGPLEPLLQDESITEIMVNGPKQVYIERGGKIYLTNVVFRDDNHVMHIIDKIVSPLGRRVDESSPYVDARLHDGSRVNAIIPPLSLVGPTITIRKFATNPYVMNDLMRFGTLSPQMAKLLDAAVKARLNIIISGGTGSGKTTLLNVLANYIPE
ncbi:MAG: ATPase, T2SS/T4P/T4SS family, partial [Syntrophomonas sp.]